MVSFQYPIPRIVLCHSTLSRGERLIINLSVSYTTDRALSLGLPVPGHALSGAFSILYHGSCFVTIIKPVDRKYGEVLSVSYTTDRALSLSALFLLASSGMTFQYPIPRIVLCHEIVTMPCTLDYHLSVSYTTDRALSPDRPSWWRQPHSAFSILYHGSCFVTISP